jgi:hypothetical protein
MSVEENSIVSRINWDAWIREIRDIGKTNGLTNFAVNEFGQIDLERSHPSGIAQFTSTGTSLLSNLVREPLAFAKALTTARRIKAKTVNHQENYGIHSSYLIGGLASLEQDGFDLNLPILLWPVQLVRKTDDFELTRAGSPFVNPALVAALFHTYGVSLDSSKVLGLLSNATDLLPIAVIDYMASLLEADANVQFQRALVIGNFAVEPSLMEADIRPEGSLLLRQLAEVSEVPDNSTEVVEEPRLVADADNTQKRIVARAVRGDSFAVETLPGSGYTQTVVNVLTALVHDGKRVMVVTPRRQTINELSERFANLGLSGLLVRSSSIWMDVVGAISRYEKSQTVDLVSAGVHREATAARLENHLEQLGKRDAAVGFSLLEVLENLAKLAAMPNAPTSIARVDLEGLNRFRDRAEALALLEKAERAGLFRYGPADSAWFGSTFETEDELQEISQLAKHLHSTQYRELQQKLDEVSVRANFRSAKSLREQGQLLELLSSVATTLDRFVPEVFDRDVSELIEATGPRKFGGAVSGSTRRKLKKLAKEYLRAGMSVSDLNLALQGIKSQREMWAQFSNVDSLPFSVSGVSDVLIAYRNFMADLARIQAHLDGVLAAELLDLSTTEFASTLATLADVTGPLENLDERNQLRSELIEAGLEAVYRDFAALHVGAQHLTSQFDLVWWQSAFELLLKSQPELAALSGDGIRALEQDFIAADSNLIRLGTLAFNALQAHHWNETLTANPEQTESLKALLRAKQATYRSVQAASGPLAKILLAAVALSPYEIAGKVPANLNFDVVLILDAAGSNVGDNISSLLRTNQVIAFGDGAIAAPVGFELEANEVPTELDDRAESIFDKVARIFGVESMRKSWRPTGQTLGSLINREFYQNRIVFEPTASDYAGRPNFEVHHVKTKPVSKADLLAESPDAEVSEAVDVVIRHAAKHPADSLMVVTASDVHAQRLRGALEAKVLELPELKQFFDSHGDEKFEVATLNELSHRVADRIIFSPGFGVLASGSASNNLGQLSQVSGRRTLANMLVSARKSLTMVTSISSETLPTEPVGAAKQFVKMFNYATAVTPVDSEIDSDPMLTDLALRLRKLGAHVTLGYTSRIPMAVSFGAKSAVILPDWNLVGDDLSERIRLRPALLAAMGWTTIRIHALEVFADPQALAIRIGDELGMQITRKPQTLFDEPSFEETDAAWGDSRESNDQRLKNDKPPHWG